MEPWSWSVPAQGGGEGRFVVVCLPSEGRPGRKRKAEKAALEDVSAGTALGRREDRWTRAAGQGRKGDQIVRQ